MTRTVAGVLDQISDTILLPLAFGAITFGMWVTNWVAYLCGYRGPLATAQAPTHCDRCGHTARTS